jgi:DNA-binding IclR family transcriptional regulator
LLTAIRELGGTVSVATAARAAGLNSKKTLARLQQLEARGEVQRIGNRWSAEPPPSELASALDRLQASTSNLRIVTGRERVS